MINKSELLNIFKGRCAKRNLKITPQRTAIYQELASACDHPSADVIYKRVRKKFPHMSFDTVNRTLLSFADIGIAKVVEGYGKPKRFDPNVETHHHFQCIRCHTIIDFHNDVYDSLEVPRDMKDKLTVFNKKVILEGLCKKCSK